MPEKVQIINAFALSKALYVAAVVPPPADMMERIVKRMFNFLWSKSTEWVARTTLYLPLERGGLGLVNVEYKIAAMYLVHLRWYMRADNNSKWKGFASY